MKKILSSILVVAVVAVGVGVATRAFFNDTETSVGNTFTAGSIDLKVSSHYTDYTSDQMGFEATDLNNRALFSFVDMKPGDMGGGRFDITAISNPYWACMKSNITGTPENRVIEPESADTTAGEDDGELQNYLSFYFWNDLDADGVYTPNDLTKDRNLYGPVTLAQVQAAGYLPLADATGVSGPSFLSGSPLEPDTEYNLGYQFCFGTWGDTPETFGLSCSGTGDHNLAQTDGVVGDIEFYAVQSRNNVEFTCASMNPVFRLETASAQNALNQVNRNYPWYTYEIDGLCIDFSLHNPNTWPAYFDFQIDNAPGTFVPGESDVIAHEGPFNGLLLGDQYSYISVPAGDAVNIEKCGTSEIKVGIHFGAEQRSYLDWATFVSP